MENGGYARSCGNGGFLVLNNISYFLFTQVVGPHSFLEVNVVTQYLHTGQSW